VGWTAGRERKASRIKDFFMTSLLGRSGIQVRASAWKRSTGHTSPGRL
jgi:hypothetical protein